MKEGIDVMTGVGRATSQEVRMCGGDMVSKGGGEVRGEPWCRSRGGGRRGEAWPGSEVGEVVGGDMGHGEVAQRRLEEGG